MRLLTRSLFAASVVASTLPSFAAETAEHTFTGNVGLFSQYIFRGLTQTNEKPALQGGFDYAHQSGFYVGVWGSNVSWISDTFPGNSASLELDVYAGYKPTFGDFFADVGVLRYQYPGSYPALPPGVVKPNTTEVYVAGGWKTISLKYSHSLGNTFTVCDADGTYYLDFTASWPIGDFTVLGHVGKQKYKGTCSGTSNNVASYNDWKIEGSWGFAKDWLLGVGYSDTDADDNATTKAFYTPASTNNFIGDGFGYVYLKKTF
jgi:uncharacterized protein (TIGR02001 family)